MPRADSEGGGETKAFKKEVDMRRPPNRRPGRYETEWRARLVSRVAARFTSMLGISMLGGLILGSAMTLPCRADGLETAAEAPELVTDRPDQTESAQVVPRRTFQLEVGWLLTREGGRGVEVDTREAPGTLLRIGVLEGVELRLGGSGWVEQELHAAAGRRSSRGLGDAEVGAKIHLGRARGMWPETALLVATSVPVGDEQLTSDRFEPSFRFSLSHTLSDRVSLGYNLGMAWSTEDREGSGRQTFSHVEYTAALGFGLSRRLGAFVELFGELPASAPGGPSNSVDGGLTYLLRPHIQLDLAGGVGLSRQAPDWFVGAGVSVRWPR